MNNAGIMSVLKHFPGYGGVGGDSHQGTVYDDKTAESIRENDLLPFKAGIEAGASSVLVAHNLSLIHIYLQKSQIKFI